MSAFFNSTSSTSVATPGLLAGAPGKLNGVKAAQSLAPWPASLLSRAVRFPSSRKFLWDRTPLARAEYIEHKDFILALKVPTDLYKSLGTGTSAFAAVSCPDGRRLQISLSHVAPETSDDVLTVQVQASLVSDGPCTPQPEGLVTAFQQSLDQRGTARLSTGVAIGVMLKFDGPVPGGVDSGLEGVNSQPSATMTATLLLPAVTLTLTPLYGKRMCDVPLAQSLSQQQLPNNFGAQVKTTRVETGYLTMDQARSLLPLSADDSNVYSVPLVGVWVRGACGVGHPALYAAALKFAFSSTLPDRAMQPDGAFLALLFTGDTPVARCYEARFTDAPPHSEAHPPGRDQECSSTGQTGHAPCGGLKLLPYMVQAKLLGQTDAPLELHPVVDHRAPPRGYLLSPPPTAAKNRHAVYRLAAAGTSTAAVGNNPVKGFGPVVGTVNSASTVLHGKCDTFSALQLRGSGSKLMTSPSKAMKILAQGGGARGAGLESGGSLLSVARPAAVCNVLSMAVQDHGTGPWSDHPQAGAHRESPPMPRRSCLPTPIRSLSVAPGAQDVAPYVSIAGSSSDSDSQPRDPRLQNRPAPASVSVMTAPAQGSVAVEWGDSVSGVMNTPGSIPDLRSTLRAAAPDALFNTHRSQRPILQQIQLRSAAMQLQLDQQAAGPAKPTAAGHTAQPILAQTPRGMLPIAGLAGGGDPRLAFGTVGAFVTVAGNGSGGAFTSQQGRLHDSSISDSQDTTLQPVGHGAANPTAHDRGLGVGDGLSLGGAGRPICGNGAPSGIGATAPRKEHHTAASHILDNRLQDAGVLTADGAPPWRTAAEAATAPTTAAADLQYPIQTPAAEVSPAAVGTSNAACSAGGQQLRGSEASSPCAKSNMSHCQGRQLLDAGPPAPCSSPFASCAEPQPQLQAERHSVDAEAPTWHGLLSSQGGLWRGRQLPESAPLHLQRAVGYGSGYGYPTGGARQLALQPQQHSKDSAATASEGATASAEYCLDDLPSDPALLRQEVLSLRRQVRQLQEQLRKLTGYQPTEGGCLELVQRPVTNPRNEALPLTSRAPAASGNGNGHSLQEHAVQEAAASEEPRRGHGRALLTQEGPQLQSQAAQQQRGQDTGQDGPFVCRQVSVQKACTMGDPPRAFLAADMASAPGAKSGEDHGAVCGYGRQASEHSDKMSVSVSAASEQGSVWSMASLRSSIMSHQPSRSPENSNSGADIGGHVGDSTGGATDTKVGLPFVSGACSSNEYVESRGAGLGCHSKSDDLPAAASASTSVPSLEEIGARGRLNLTTGGWPQSALANSLRYLHQGRACALAASSDRGRRRARKASTSEGEDESDHQQPSDYDDHGETSRRKHATAPGIARPTALKIEARACASELVGDRACCESASDMGVRSGGAYTRSDSVVIRTTYVPLGEDSDSSDSESELLLMQKYGICT